VNFVSLADVLEGRMKFFWGFNLSGADWVL
jgi:hypothetical protein